MAFTRTSLLPNSIRTNNAQRGNQYISALALAESERAGGSVEVVLGAQCWERRRPRLLATIFKQLGFLRVLQTRNQGAGTPRPQHGVSSNLNHQQINLARGISVFFEPQHSFPNQIKFNLILATRTRNLYRQTNTHSLTRLQW